MLHPETSQLTLLALTESSFGMNSPLDPEARSIPLVVLIDLDPLMSALDDVIFPFKPFHVPSYCLVHPK